MTDLEKIAYTKSFIDKIANGINPLDGTAIPDTDLLSNVRMVRCMFYVSDILRRIIDNGGISPAPIVSAPKTKKLDFAITEEQKSRFMYSDDPVTLSDIAKQLNGLVNDEEYKKISYKHISEWLINAGFLKTLQKQDGKTVKRPTDEGIALGIATEYRESQHGPYTVVVYTREAQEFIIDNLDAVIAYMQEMKNAPKESKDNKENIDNQYAPWTTGQSSQLINMVIEGESVSDIAAVMRRSEADIRSQIKKLGFDE